MAGEHFIQKITTPDSQLYYLQDWDLHQAKAAGLVYAGPASGDAAVPTFRALSDDDFAALYTTGTTTIDPTHLPSYVDDVIEAETYDDLPATGEAGKIYVLTVGDATHPQNSMFRWGGSQYVQISSGVQSELDSVTRYVAISATGGGSVTNGTVATFSQGKDSFTAASLGEGFYTAGTVATFSQGEDSFTAATHGADQFAPAELQIGFYKAGIAASFASGAFNQGTLPTLSYKPDANDSTNLVISWSQGTLPTHESDSFTQNTPTVIDITKFSGGSFTSGAFSGGSFKQGTDQFTANTPTAIDVSTFSGGSFHQGTDSFTQNKPTAVTLPSFSEQVIVTGYRP